MARGDVFFSRNHQFDDGGIAKKLLILLNDPIEDNCYFFVKTTSQKKYKKNLPGCYSNDRGQGYYVIPKNVDWFKEDFTWVLFYPIIKMSSEEVLKESLEKRNLQYQTTLKDKTIRSIINCMKNSIHVTGFDVDIIAKKR